MKPEQIRIKIAEACGWQYVNFNYILQGVWQNVGSFPDYLDDLNACHEMEKSLTPEQLAVYSSHLCRKAGGWNERATNATATQRCEAFLRTLNLWIDS